MSDEDSNLEPKVLKRLSLNTRLSAARIFEEESNESSKSAENKSGGKMRSSKRDFKSSPYKNEKTDQRNERPQKPKIEYETDPAILDRRQKQIDYGKNTAGYDNYLKMIPKKERTREHPKTPIKYIKYSRRGWDGLIKNWRQKLHEFDTDAQKSSINKLDGKKESDEDVEEYDDDDIKRELDEIEQVIDFL